MSNTKEIQNRKINAKLYPIYKMLSWDLLFYYSIIYLFLTQEKNFSASQVLLGEAEFTIFCLVIQIPIGLIVDKFGKKNSLIFANFCMCLFSILLIMTKTYTQLLIAYFIDAVGYVIKGVCETNILYDSLPRGKKRGKLYSEIDGKGTSRYYILDAITSLMAGFTYVINPYIPILLCLIANIFSTILATRFRHTQMPGEEKDKHIGVKKYFKQLKGTIKFVKKSKRMFCLLIFFGLISGLMYNMTTLRSGVLEQIQLPEQYFGIVLAICQIVAAMCANAQNLIHAKYRNKTLAYLGIPLTMSCIIIGFLTMTRVTISKTFLIILIFVIQGAIKGPYNVLIYRYLNNFTNRNIRTKLSTIRNIVYNISTILISLLGALLLHFSDAANTILIIGCILTAIVVLLLDYMKDKVGLKVNEYSENDLKYATIQNNIIEGAKNESKTRI